MTALTPTRRRFRPTPAWLVLGLLVVEGLLWLSERFLWFGFNEKKGWTVLVAVAAVGGAMLLILLWFIASLLLRWRFQFSIRLLLVLTVAVAIPFSWLAVEMKKVNEQKEAVAAIMATPGGGVSYDYECDSCGKRITGGTPGGPQSLRRLLEDNFFNRVVQVSVARCPLVVKLRFPHVVGGQRLADQAPAGARSACPCAFVPAYIQVETRYDR